VLGLWGVGGGGWGGGGGGGFTARVVSSTMLGAAAWTPGSANACRPVHLVRVVFFSAAAAIFVRLPVRQVVECWREGDRGFDWLAARCAPAGRPCVTMAHLLGRPISRPTSCARDLSVPMA